LYKKIALYLFLLSFTGCSVFKDQNYRTIGNKSTIDLEDLRKNNLTNNSFFVQKAEVEIVTDNEKEGFLVSVKFTQPDSFLVSLRSKAGLEAARIFMTADTLLINDRINRILYFGSGNDLKKRIGYSSKLIPVLLGDLISLRGDINTIGNCLDEIYTVNSSYDSYSLKYRMNCNSDRLEKLEVSGGVDTNPLIIEYSDSRKSGNINYYSKVLVYDLSKAKYLTINYRKIESPYKGFIEFIPGRNYEAVRIK
jgi:hypothetical protein